MANTLPNQKNHERNFILVHQNVCINEIDMIKRKLIGFVEIHFVPTKLNLKRVRLNAKQCLITKLLARGSGQYESCTFTFNDPQLDVVPDDETNGERSVKKFVENYQDAVMSTDPDQGCGELIIELPQSVQKDISDGSTFRILIEYQIENPNGGLHFVTSKPKNPDIDSTITSSENIPSQPTSDEIVMQISPIAQIKNTSKSSDNELKKDSDTSDSCDKRLVHAHCFTYHEDSRLWFPCIDSYNQPCTWILEFNVHPDLVAISCGQLISSTLSQCKKFKTYTYELNVPTAAPNIGFVIGNFETYNEPTSTIKNYYLPGLKKLAIDSCSFMYGCFDYYEDLLNFKFPYPDLKQVFVDEAYPDFQNYAGLSICSTNILHSKRIIDQTFKTHKILSNALAKQYFGCFLGSSSSNSTWLVRGISAYIGSQYQKKIFGNNEYRFKVQKTMKKLIQYEQRVGGVILDNQTSEISRYVSSPLYFSTYSHQTTSPYYDKAHQRKSFLVLRMLEDRIGSLLLLQVLNKILSLASTASIQPAGVNAWSNMLISTTSFERSVFSVTGKDKEIASFLDHWIFRPGHAKFNGRFVFDRKRNVVELEIRQSDTSSTGVRPYFGPITVTVQELDGTFAHKLNIEENMSTPFVITCHSKSRRNKKKKIPLCTGEEVDMDLSMMDNNESPVLWIRIDPDMQLLRQVIFEQPDYQWQYQLKHERDVTAQLDALDVLETYPTVVTRRILTEMIEDEKCYYRVRCSAALKLTKVANQMASFGTSGGWQASTSMINIFKKMFGSQTCPHIIKSNQFSTTSLQSYFLQKTIPKALAGLRMQPHRNCPPEVFKFLLDLLKFNENNKNTFSDNYYKAALVEALAETVTPVVLPLFIGNPMQPPSIDNISIEIKYVIDEIARSLNLEKVLPCYKYTVTIACLKAIRQLQKCGHLPSNPHLFRSYTGYNIFFDVRCAAAIELVDIIRAENSQDDLIFLISLLERDPVPAFKFHILSQLYSCPPMIHNFQSAKFVREYLWKLMNTVYAHDTKLRCATVDLYHRLFDRTEKFIVNVGLAGDGYRVKKKKKKDKKSREDRKDKERKRELKKQRKLQQLEARNQQACP